MNMNKYIWMVLCLALLIGGCARETVVLLPMPDGKPSAVVIAPRQGGEVVLAKAGMAVDVSGETAGATYTLTEDRIKERFDPALKSLPDAPERFLLYFQSGTTDLLTESLALLPDVLQSVKTRQSTDVSVVGHADREGNRAWNFTLSKQRAEKVSGLLKQMGLDPDIMEITSHGEENPLVPTADNVAEPRNRRVEVIVR